MFVTETLGHSTTLKIANIYPGRQTNGSTVTTAGGDASAGQLVAYGFWDDSITSRFPVKLALLNLQIFNSTQSGTRPMSTFDISAFVPPGVSSVTVQRLTAPGADAQDANVTLWAGQTFEDGLANGRHVIETVKGHKINVDASSAVLVLLSS